MQRETMVTAKASMYEKAPDDDINDSVRNQDFPGSSRYGATSEDKKNLKGLESEINSLQMEVNKIMKMHQGEESGDDSKMYAWQTSDGDKPGDKTAPYTFFHLLIVFILCSLLGAYLVM